MAKDRHYPPAPAEPPPPPAPPGGKSAGHTKAVEAMLTPELQAIARYIDGKTPEGWGFAALMFETGDGPNRPLLYVSNAQRPDIVAVMREFIRRNAGERADPLPELVALARQYASECGECAGVGVDPEDRDCEECRPVRDLIARAEGAPATDPMAAAAPAMLEALRQLVRLLESAIDAEDLQALLELIARAEGRR